MFYFVFLIIVCFVEKLEYKGYVKIVSEGCLLLVYFIE